MSDKLEPKDVVVQAVEAYKMGHVSLGHVIQAFDAALDARAAAAMERAAVICEAEAAFVKREEPYSAMCAENCATAIRAALHA
jgi:hypothetical protein